MPPVIPRLRHLQARGSFICVQSSQVYSSWYCSNNIVSAIHRLILTSVPDERSTSQRRNHPDALLQQPQHRPCVPTHFRVAFDGNGTQTRDECPASMTILRILRQPNLFAKDKPASRTSHHTRSRQQVPLSIHPRNAENPPKRRIES